MNMVKKFILITVVGFFFSLTASSQSFNQSTLTWSANEVVDLEKGDTIAMKCSFKTVGGAQLIWSQRNGALNTTYQITSLEGTWTNVAEPGSVTLTLLRNGKSSKARVERTKGGISITMDFSRPEAASHLYFRIVSVQ